MIIERVSRFSGKAHHMDLPVTQEQLDRLEAGELVQRAFPHLNPEQREFLMTGATPEEWRAMFGNGEDE